MQRKHDLLLRIQAAVVYCVVSRIQAAGYRFCVLIQGTVFLLLMKTMYIQQLREELLIHGSKMASDKGK